MNKYIIYYRVKIYTVYKSVRQYTFLVYYVCCSSIANFWLTFVPFEANSFYFYHAKYEKHAFLLHQIACRSLSVANFFEK
jgi:hypothetical protein